MTQNGIVLVASVSIMKDNEVLMIQEDKPTARNKWNFPAGRIEPGEEIPFAACREVKEETGYDVVLTGTTGIYNFVSSANKQVILFHFTAEIIGGALNLQEEQIIDSKWIPLSELMEFHREKLRDPDVIKQITGRLMEQNLYSMDVFHEQVSL
ncbi:NUDIX hydrolase [Brevibacillus ginsengisoli]|uniref:NUDIX hydrolase n=1 Tax=Brevibacillus ginsengisoli TaxID=363854 RepID=UPI003CF6BC49